MRMLNVGRIMTRKKISKVVKRELITIRLQGWVLDWLLHQQESSGVVIEQALIEMYQIDMPEHEE